MKRLKFARAVGFGLSGLVIRLKLNPKALGYEFVIVTLCYYRGTARTGVPQFTNGIILKKAKIWSGGRNTFYTLPRLFHKLNCIFGIHFERSS